MMIINYSVNLRNGRGCSKFAVAVMLRLGLRLHKTSLAIVDKVRALYSPEKQVLFKIHNSLKYVPAPV